jgi:hypothetical protein
VPAIRRRTSKAFCRMRGLSTPRSRASNTGARRAPRHWRIIGGVRDAYELTVFGVLTLSIWKTALLSGARAHPNPLGLPPVARACRTVRALTPVRPFFFASAVPSCARPSSSAIGLRNFPICNNRSRREGRTRQGRDRPVSSYPPNSGESVYGLKLRRGG